MLLISSSRLKSTCGSVGVFTAHVEKLFIQEYPPTLEKVISAKLMEDFAIHIMAQSPTFVVIYQHSTKTQHRDSRVENPAHPYFP